jgi:hypothetical protein
VLQWSLVAVEQNTNSFTRELESRGSGLRPARRIMRREMWELLEESGVKGNVIRCFDDIRIGVWFTSIDLATEFVKFISATNKWYRYDAPTPKFDGVTVHVPNRGTTKLTLQFNYDYIKSMIPLEDTA